MELRQSLAVGIALSAALLGACGRGEGEIVITDSRVPSGVMFGHADPSPEIVVRFTAENQGDETAQGCVLRWSLDGEPATADPDPTSIPPGESRTFSGEGFPSYTAKPIVSEAHVECSNARSEVVRATITPAIE